MCAFIYVRFRLSSLLFSRCLRSLLIFSYLIILHSSLSSFSFHPLSLLKPFPLVFSHLFQPISFSFLALHVIPRLSSHLILSNLILYPFIFFCLLFSSLILCYLFSFCLILSPSIFFCLLFSSLLFSYLIFSFCFVLSYLYLILSYLFF